MNDVFFLSCGGMEVSRLWVDPPGHRSGMRRLSLTVAVVVRPNGDVALVDAGWSAATCAEPRRALGLVYASTLGVCVSPRDAIVEQLKGLGIEASRVKTVLPTHLHLDHVNGVADFPDAEVICTEEEWRAWKRRPRGVGYREKDLGGRDRLRAVQLASPAHLGFPGSHDVFGDGSVVLLRAVGHTRGHTAVAVRGTERLYVHTGDAADLRWEWERGQPSIQSRWIAWSVKHLQATYECLRACEADPARPFLVAAHDDDVFRTLPHQPGDQGRARASSPR